MIEQKIALGTVQFGMQYGIANKTGKISKDNAFGLLEYAYKRSIRYLDTAHSYGESEEIIGKFISNSKKEFNIISKMPHLDKRSNPSKIEGFFEETLKRLKQPKIYGYLVHRFDDLVANRGGVWLELEKLKQKGFVDKIGVSVYKPEEADFLLNNGFNFDLIQVPFNILDQRFSRCFTPLKDRNVEIYSRSAFLQGLFFLGLDAIEKRFPAAKEAVKKLCTISQEHKIPVYALCLCFAVLNPSIDKVVIGVDSVAQLQQNLDSLEYLDKTKAIYGLLEPLEFNNEEVIIPSNWK